MIKSTAILLINMLIGSQKPVFNRDQYIPNVFQKSVFLRSRRSKFRVDEDDAKASPLLTIGRVLATLKFEMPASQKTDF